MTADKLFTNHIFIDLRGRDFKGLNYWFVSRRGASRDLGTDVIITTRVSRRSTGSGVYLVERSVKDRASRLRTKLVWYRIIFSV